MTTILPAYELIGSRRGRSSWDARPTYDKVYRVDGSSLATDAIASIASKLPASIADPLTGVALFAKDYSWEPRSLQSFELTVTYTDPKQVDDRRQLQSGEFRWSDDFTAKTQKTFVGYAQTRYPGGVGIGVAGPGGADDPPDFQGALGIKQVNGKWTVEGEDVLVPNQVRTLSYRFAGGAVDEAYLAAACDLVATCNDDTFHGYDAFRCLLLGFTCSNSFCSGNLSGPQLDFKLLIGRNFTIAGGNPLTIGTLTNIEKYAHQHIQPIFKDQVDSGVNPPFVRQVPRWAYVTDVYYAGDWSTLGV